ncbi:hypothetical protein [Massilia brevitalea]|uniref:hypothetical protein n=1 Tax=Massilia brevitalea TaxID=442526 RepID=UPI00273929F3|nr:hypothetical protein [Massilia brevitalea]
MRTSRKHWGFDWAAALSCCLGCCLALPAWAQAPAQAPPASLCNAGEQVVFACAMEGKTLSLCRPSLPGNGLQYRFGSPARLELEYPAPGQRVQPVFKVRDEPLIGGGLTSVAFQRSGYTYTVYSRVGRGPDGVTPEFDDGLTVERRGKTLRHSHCEDGGAGFLEPPAALVK